MWEFKNHYLKKKLILFIYLSLAVLGLCCCTGFPPVVEWGLLSSCDAQLLIAGTSHAADHRLQGTRTSVVAAPGL